MMEKIVTQMDEFEVEEQVAKVLLATDPYEYLASTVDRLSAAADEPSDIDIAAEILEKLETDLQMVASDTSLVLDDRVEAVIKYGQHSEVGLRIIFSLFKEIGFPLDTMEAAVEIRSENPITKLNNLSVLKTLREIYAGEA